MSNPFFEHPILNSPYELTKRHWELDTDGQPTQRIIETRRRAEFISPIPKPKKRKGLTEQQQIVFDEGKGLSTEAQQYEQTSLINAVRHEVGKWRALPNPNTWHVTPETVQLLQHWRHHDFNSLRPFFCQIEAVETAIWLTEVAPTAGKAGKGFLDHLEDANHNANPEIMRLALKLATGAGKTTVMAMLVDVERAKMVITNYHAFKLHERLELSKGGHSLLQGRGEALNTIETEGQMVQRVMPDLMGIKNIMVINDEAHQCYREKPNHDIEERLKGDERI